MMEYHISIHEKYQGNFNNIVNKPPRILKVSASLFFISPSKVRGQEGGSLMQGDGRAGVSTGTLGSNLRAVFV
jgi:hypothetical protein